MTDSAVPAARPPPPTLLRRPEFAGLLLALATLLVWASSFPGTFVFDDFSGIVHNPSIRSLWPLSDVLAPPPVGGLTISGRPLLNLSFGVSYWLSGPAPWGFHAVNVAIHLLCGLFLFGVVRRTLERRLAGRESPALAIAWVVALLWILHPLQTESVTYLVQRAESLMGLCFLLTLYGFIRSLDAARPLLWRAVSVGACLLGAATKEVIVLAPLLTLLYDRTFVGGTWREAWRQRGRFHLALLSSWLVLGALLAATGWGRGHTVGFGLGISPAGYWLTQCGAVLRYLGLVFAPHPLIGDYGTTLAAAGSPALVSTLAVGLLVAAVGISLVRWPAIGYLGAWFFAILAPTSVVPIATQTVAEHRMYLPLAAVLTLAVLAAWRWFGRVALAAAATLAVALGWLTVERNAVYRSPKAFWTDVASRRPDNPRAHLNLGNLQLESGQPAAAIAEYQVALRLNPSLPEGASNLCNALRQLGRPAEAAVWGEAALRLDPDFADAHVNLGKALVDLGRVPEAIGHYEQALRRVPSATDIHLDLALALEQSHRPDEAIAQYQAALQLAPEITATRYALALALLRRGDFAEAWRHYQAATRQDPKFADARFAMANALAGAGRFSEALPEYEAVVRLKPDDVQARNNLGNTCVVLGRIDEALAAYADALRLQPNDSAIQENLRIARALRDEANAKQESHP